MAEVVLAGAIDQGVFVDPALLRDGWFNASQRLSPWSWRDVPLRPMRDWDAVAKAHEAEHKQDVERLRRDLRERGNAMADAVLVRLARSFKEFMPSLRVNVDKKVLERAYDQKEPILISDEHWRLLCDRVRQMDDRPQEAFEAAVTRVILHRLLKRSHRDGITIGALPRRPSFSATTQPSPFFPGLGLAVRHAQLLRTMLLEHVPERRSHDQGPLALLSVLLYSPYRKVPWAVAAVNGVRLAHDRVTIASDIFLSMNQMHGQFRMSRDAGNKLAGGWFSVVRHWAYCPICSGEVEVRPGGESFPGWLVGRCSDSPLGML